jgi:uncharacterized damage-inducible protein DinB
MNAEQAKFLTEYFAKMIESEVPTTAKVIGAVPEDRKDYKPDEKSRSAWDLAKHLATSDIMFLDGIINGSFAFDPNAPEPAGLNTVQDLVTFYTREIPARLKRLRDLPGEKLAEPVDFFGVMKLPDAAYLGFAQNHAVHHRGQLAAYLRAMGGKVPSIYGGSADEPYEAAATT